VLPAVTHLHRQQCAQSVPKRGPGTVTREPTPTNVPIKNGPEIINFRPVLESPLALANRRLPGTGGKLILVGVTRFEPATFRFRDREPPRRPGVPLAGDVSLRAGRRRRLWFAISPRSVVTRRAVRFQSVDGCRLASFAMTHVSWRACRPGSPSRPYTYTPQFRQGPAEGVGSRNWPQGVRPEVPFRPEPPSGLEGQ
jgi:hypothetical protein